MATALARTTTAQGLLEGNATVGGVALSDPKTITDTEVSVQAQFIYQDRTEAQTYLLAKTFNGWKIARTEEAQGAKTWCPMGPRSA
jgi:hypothetical protein